MPRFYFKERLDLEETILNIYLIIEKNLVIGFRALSYVKEGSDDEKISFLKSKAEEDFEEAEVFPAPSDKAGNYMTYNRFAKLEKQGMHYRLFENIFESFDIPENPLICVTPVTDGEILTS